MSVQLQPGTASEDTITTMDQDQMQQPQPAATSKKATKKRKKKRSISEKPRVLAVGKPAPTSPLYAVLDLGGRLYPVDFKKVIGWRTVKVGDVVCGKWSRRIIKGTLVKIGTIHEVAPLLNAEADRHYNDDTVHDLDAYTVKKFKGACTILTRSSPARSPVMQRQWSAPPSQPAETTQVHTGMEERMDNLTIL
ncbi:uncharacterized protein LOC144876403 [Branchiostoma floridae x Branchiostoma japonicum]